MSFSQDGNHRQLRWKSKLASKNYIIKLYYYYIEMHATSKRVLKIIGLIFGVFIIDQFQYLSAGGTAPI